VIGYRLLFKVKLFPIGKTLAYSFFCIVFFSIAIGFIHAFIIDYPHFLEGEFGYWSNVLLDAQLGQAGTGGILAFAGLTVLIIAYNIDFKLPERKKVSPAGGDLKGAFCIKALSIERLRNIFCCRRRFVCFYNPVYPVCGIRRTQGGCFYTGQAWPHRNR